MVEHLRIRGIVPCETPYCTGYSSCTCGGCDIHCELEVMKSSLDNGLLLFSIKEKPKK